MQNIATDLLLLITNLSQLKSKIRIKSIFTDGISEIFKGSNIKWHENSDNTISEIMPVCTRNKTYGYIEIESDYISRYQNYIPHLQNAIQLLAIILERIEQENVLTEYQKKLQDIIYEQTKSLIEKNNELNESNEELAVTNEGLTDLNRSLLEANNDLEREIEKRAEVEKKLRDSDKFFNHASDMLCIAGFDGYFKVLNPAWEKVLGWTIKEMLSKPWIEFVHQDDADKTDNIKSTIVGGEKVDRFENRFLCKTGQYKWLSWNSYPQPEENLMFGVARDITSAKESEQRLKQIEWMLDTKSKDVGRQVYEPFYGDLTKLNNNGLIINTVGKDVLSDFASDYLNLLETSSAIYESNGDYAMGLFSSGWCRYMDSASRKLCNTSNNKKALESGKWLCHESCWKASKEAIENGKVVDKKCMGGINLYVEPIIASGKVVGAVNFGYGDPPSGETELKELADKYQANYTELAELSQSYESRPPFIVELAKKRLNYSARRIGQLIERTQSEERIMESEERYRNLINFAPDAFFQGKPSGDFIDCNEKAVELTGYSREELLKMNISQLFSNSELNDRPLRYDILKKGKTVITEGELMRKNGKTVLVEMNSKMLLNGTLQSFVRDITGRKKTEEQLRTLTHAINQSPNSVVVTNNKGIIEYVNPIIEKISGFKKDELIGENPRIFSSGITSKEEYKQLWDTITKGNVWQGEFQNKKKNGEIFWESATISPVFDNKGKITHFLAIREDITEQKRMTQELITAKERAEESDRLKSSFLANMSHEIRTPMNSIMGFASLLPEEESKDLMCNYANIIVKNSEQLVHIIDDIVLYSRLQTRLLQNIPTEFNACDLMNDIQQSFNLPEFKEKGIDLINQNLTGQVCFVKTDYDKLRQIFTNLISNAFKYTKTGSITFGIDTIDNEQCYFVKDTGVGIPNAEIDKVFNRFYRGSNVVQGSIGGTGLGLSIVKELVELLEGKIWVESTEGKGSTFWFTINSREAVQSQ